MVFPRQNLPLPHRPFPFHPPVQMLPKLNTRLPLSPYCNPLPAQNDSLGVFHNKVFRLLASFASMVSRSDSAAAVATSKLPQVLFPRILTQGRLHCTQHTILCTALQVHTRLVREEASPAGSSQLRRTIPGLHGNWVVCAMPLARALNP